MNKYAVLLTLSFLSSVSLVEAKGFNFLEAIDDQLANNNRLQQHPTSATMVNRAEGEDFQIQLAQAISLSEAEAKKVQEKSEKQLDDFLLAIVYSKSEAEAKESRRTAA